MGHVTVERTVFIKDMKEAFKAARYELASDGDLENFDTIYEVRQSILVSAPVRSDDYDKIYEIIDKEVQAHLDTWNNGSRFRSGFNNRGLDTCAVAIPVINPQGKEGWIFVANIHV